MTNLKLVLRTYTALRQMSPDDIALLETLRALNENDRELLLETMAGKATGKKSATKTRTYQRCEQCDKTKGHAFHKDSSNDGYHVFQSPAPSESKSSTKKSERASGIHAQLKERRSEQREPMTTKDDDYGNGEQRCTVLRGDLGGTICGLLPDHNVHHLQSSRGFHPFQSSTTAPPAPASLPANGGVGSTTANSGTLTDDAGTVAHGASGGN